MIPGARLHNQYIANPFARSAAELVRSFGAVQAQEYPFAKWGLALRLRGTPVESEIEAAFTRGEILRTHVMRPTWHFVTADDITWLLDLTATRVRAATAAYFRSNGLDTRLLTRATAMIERVVSGGRHLTRAELRTELARGRVRLSALQLGLLSLYAESEKVICSGPRRGKQFTYASLSERLAAVGASRTQVPGERDEAIAELAKRYFSRHGPATVRDFVWWSGLKSGEARRGVEMIRAKPLSSDQLTYWFVDDLVPARSTGVQLLPIYDEYVVAYRDRVAVPYGPGSVRRLTGATTFRHVVVIDGQIAGTWRTEQKGSTTVVAVTPLRLLRPRERDGIAAAVARYARHIQSEVTVSVDGRRSTVDGAVHR